MSTNKNIEPPQTLASLPKPIDTVNGRIQAALVHSLNGSKKRKRTEICSCTDGEGINIYNVSCDSHQAAAGINVIGRYEHRAS